jgi:hypothetical protein
MIGDGKFSEVGSRHAGIDVSGCLGWRLCESAD